MKNKNFFLSERHSPFFYTGIWITLHLIIICAAFFRGTPQINTDLFDILPPSSSLRIAAVADKQLSSTTSRGLYILTAHSDFSAAYAAAEELYFRFADNDSFEELELYFDTGVVDQITQYLHKNRYHLMDRQTIALLESGNTQTVANDALGAIFSAFTFTDLSQLHEDPFMLTERRMKSFISSALAGSTSMTQKEDVLAAEYNGIWYIMLQGKLTPQASAVNNTNGIIKSIYNFCTELENMDTGLSFIFSGVPFHSYESASNAESQITIITVISIILVALLLLYIFKSVIPMFISLCSISVSAVTALCAVVACIGEIHILTFVFGTTLIGMGIDYSIHYFMSQKAKPQNNGNAIIKNIFKGITFGFISTEICFLLLSVAPFPILRQISVFLSAGLLSSYVSVVCLYRYIPSSVQKSKTGKEIKLKIPDACVKAAVFFRPAKRRTVLIISFILCSVVIIVVNSRNVKIENNMRSLYTMSDKLIHSEMIASKVLNHGSSGWYYIIMGDSQEELLYNEEQLCIRLEQEKQNGFISSYFATTLFLPSPHMQRKSYNAAEALIQAADAQLKALGFGQKEIQTYTQDYYAQKQLILTAEESIPPYLQNVISNLWVGEIDGKWYSAVMPLHAKNESVFRDIADQNPNVVFVNKMADISKELDKLTGIMLWLQVIAYIVILLLLRIWYSTKDIMRIGFIPLFIVIITEAVLASCGLSIGFFSAAALLLVFGAGLDYIIYTLESEHKNAEYDSSRAILLSYVTTALSFGALIFTSFAPVHIFGLTVLSGLTAGYICTVLIKSHPSGKTTDSGSGRFRGEATVKTNSLPQKEDSKNCLK